MGNKISKGKAPKKTKSKSGKGNNTVAKTASKPKKYKNLKPFKKGTSGNPKGRKPEPPELKDFKKWCREKCTEPKFIKHIEKRMEKSDKILMEVIHYGVGKPVDEIKLSASLDTHAKFSEMSDEEIKKQHDEMVEKIREGYVKVDENK